MIIYSISIKIIKANKLTLTYMNNIKSNIREMDLSGIVKVLFSGIWIILTFTILGLFIGLSILGLACSIYHPVGIAWVVNSSKKKEKL